MHTSALASTAQHTFWPLVANNGTGAPPPTDMGASFGVAISCVLSLFILAQANGSSLWLGKVDQLYGTRS